MADYIARIAALEEVEEWADTFCECDYVFPHILESIKKLPAVDVREVKRAQWALCAKGVVMCTNCCAVGHSSFQYCPKCGAQMRKEGGET